MIEKQKFRVEVIGTLYKWTTVEVEAENSGDANDIVGDLARSGNLDANEGIIFETGRIQYNIKHTWPVKTSRKKVRK